MKILKWIDEYFELVIGSSCLVGMVISVFVQVISRYVSKTPSTWTEELTRDLFIWMVFATIGICAKRGKHIRITLLQAKLPKKILPFVEIFSDLCFLYVAAVCGYVGYDIVNTMRSAGQYSSSMPWLHRWVIYLMVPLGFAFAIFRIVQDIVMNIKEIRKNKLDNNGEVKEVKA